MHRREIRGSAPASTGDTSPLVAQPAVRELVLAALSGTDKRLLREGGTPRHELSGTSGPLRPEVTLRRREILVDAVHAGGVALAGGVARLLG